MKKEIFKIAIMSLVAALMFIATPETASAQVSKKLEKKLQKEKDKEYKKKIKEYQKEGWKLTGSSRTLEVALLEHYYKLAESAQNKEMAGEVSQCKSINVCKQFALNNAQNNYAAKASGNIKGRTESLLRADANMPETEIDKFMSAYENIIKQEVGGVLTESYSIIKDNGSTKEYKTIFILNEEKAVQARAKALEKSLLETKITIKEAEEISKFVNEGFNIE
ncbi:MAG: hypothetical protein LBP63_08770 [Prevotellaceae bacterium]|jgi:hypothetical protein|nr:hypothetical protein [Prevotellaceae bacterium]